MSHAGNGDGPAVRVPLREAFPELTARLDRRREALVRDRSVATLEVHEPGRWSPEDHFENGPGHLGLYILEGFMTRDVVLGDTVATELVGRGDLLRPADHDGASAPVPFDVAWTALSPVRVAVLDARFAQVAAHLPELLETVVSAGVRRSQSLALHLAVSHLRRVEMRLHVLMWHLADRWGKVTPEGVCIPLKLTHQTLGRLVGAQRPSVTTAMNELARSGTLTRGPAGTWVLHGDPPEVVRP